MLPDEITSEFMVFVPYSDNYLLENLRILHEDSDLEEFSNTPNDVFKPQISNLLIVHSRGACYGEIDWCELGCWRIMARDKLIKCKETGKILGFKRILKFCEKNKERANKKSWVMEEYRFKKNQDQAMCKIQLMFEGEISMLINKHFSSNYYKSSDQQEKDESYLELLIDFNENYWFRDWKIDSNVYRVDPLTLVDIEDRNFLENGSCIYAYAEEIYESFFFPLREERVGYWRILERDGMIKSKRRKLMGYKRVLQFYETEKRRIVCGRGEEIEENWIVEEYRLAEEGKEDNVICIIKLMSSYKLNRFLKMSLGTCDIGQ